MPVVRKLQQEVHRIVATPFFKERMAALELKPEARVTEKELIEFCKREISGFKVPRVVRMVTEWPMSSSKIQKFRLRTALVEELGLA